MVSLYPELSVRTWQQPFANTVLWIPNIALRILYTYTWNYGIVVSRIFGTIVTETVCKHSVINSSHTRSRNKFKIGTGIPTLRQVFWSHFDTDSCCICSPDIQHRCLQTVAVTFDRNSLKKITVKLRYQPLNEKITRCSVELISRDVFGDLLFREINVGNTIELAWPGLRSSVFKRISITETSFGKKHSIRKKMIYDLKWAEPKRVLFVKCGLLSCKNESQVTRLGFKSGRIYEISLGRFSVPKLTATKSWR